MSNTAEGIFWNPSIARVSIGHDKVFLSLHFTNCKQCQTDGSERGRERLTSNNG